MAKSKSVRNLKKSSSRNKTMRKNKKINQLKTFIKKMFTLQLTLKMVHWTTKSHSVHKTTDDAMEKLDGLIDSFVETYLGKHTFGLMKQNTVKNISIKNVSSKKDLNKLIGEYVEYLTKFNNIENEDKNPDLLGIRDSILSELNILRYLLHLEK
tara:strand:+ start:3738 stop:4199 length:462 start_codon:yes stop_codon:yes gene_type:complete